MTRRSEPKRQIAARRAVKQRRAVKHRVRGVRRPPALHPTSWLYALAVREVGVTGRPSAGPDEPSQSWRRRVSRVFYRKLAEAGIDVGRELPRVAPPPKRRAVTLFARPEVVALSGHVPTVIVPPGWTREADVREELLALSEISALRKVG